MKAKLESDIPTSPDQACSSLLPPSVATNEKNDVAKVEVPRFLRACDFWTTPKLPNGVLVVLLYCRLRFSDEKSKKEKELLLTRRISGCPLPNPD